MFGEFDRCGACHVVDGGLCHIIGHRRGDGDHGVRGTDDDDAAPIPLLDHLQGGSTHAKERPPHGDVHGLLELLQVRFEHQLTLAVDGIRDEHVQTAKGCRGLGDHAFHTFAVGHVPLQHDRLATQAANFLCHRFGLIEAGMVVDGDVGPFAGHFQGTTLADPAG